MASLADLVYWGITSFALLVLLGESFLAYVVWRRGATLASRFLAAFLVLHGVGFGFMLLADAEVIPIEFGGVAGSFVFLVVMSLVIAGMAALLVAFSLSYPGLHAILRGNPARLWPLFVVALLLGILVGIVSVLEYVYSAALVYVSYSFPFTDIAVIVMMVSLPAAAVTCSAVLWTRGRRSRNRLERRRTLLLVRAFSLPFAAGALLFVAIVLLELLLTTNGRSLNEGLLFAVGAVSVVLALVVPPLGLAYGVLRYRIVNLDLGLRTSLRQSLLGGLFLAAFFVVSEGAQAILEDRTQSAVVGIFGTLPLLFFLSPIQHAADRLAGRVMPSALDTIKYREFRRWEVYRATFEELSGDRRITARERRALQSLAGSLGLSRDQASTIEGETVRDGPSLRKSAKA